MLTYESVGDDVNMPSTYTITERKITAGLLDNFGGPCTSGYEILEPISRKGDSTIVVVCGLWGGVATRQGDC